MKSIWIALINVMLFVASASAASSVLQGTSRMLTEIRFKARIFGLKRQTLADCSRRLKRM